MYLIYCSKKLISKYYLVILGLPLLSYIQYQLLREFYLKSEVINIMTTFLSIVFGFYITSYAIFLTSSYVSSLYKITDAKNKAQTLLHTLVQQYRFGLTAILFSIIYLLCLQFRLNQSNNNQLAMGDIYTLPFLFVVVFNFWYSYRMLDILVKIVIQEAKRKKD